MDTETGIEWEARIQEVLERLLAELEAGQEGVAPGIRSQWRRVGALLR